MKRLTTIIIPSGYLNFPFKCCLICFMFLLALSRGSSQTGNIVTPVLLNKISIPKELRTTSHGLEYGGDIRIGDLLNNSEAEFLV